MSGKDRKMNKRQAKKQHHLALALFGQSYQENREYLKSWQRYMIKNKHEHKIFRGIFTDIETSMMEMGLYTEEGLIEMYYGIKPDKKTRWRQIRKLNNEKSR